MFIILYYSIICDILWTHVNRNSENSLFLLILIYNMSCMLMNDKKKMFDLSFIKM